MELAVSLGTLSRLVVPRMLGAGWLVSSATAFRVALGQVELFAKRTPSLTGLAVSALAGGRAAQAAFRDDALALARESAEISWRELRRAVDDLDAFTRPGHEPWAQPFRPYRVKL